jgi:hypothetical protein
MLAGRRRSPERPRRPEIRGGVAVGTWNAIGPQGLDVRQRTALLRRQLRSRLARSRKPQLGRSEHLRGLTDRRALLAQLIVDLAEQLGADRDIGDRAGQHDGDRDGGGADEGDAAAQAQGSSRRM